MEDQSTEQDPSTAQAVGPRPAKDLVADAMACVAWDGMVDTERLATFEFAHDETITRRVVAHVAASLDSSASSAHPRSNGIEIPMKMFDPFALVHEMVSRSGGQWHIFYRAVSACLTDEHLTLYCALCARHPCFSMSWRVAAGTGTGTVRHPKNSPRFIEWKDMWMSRVVRALAAMSGAWTGDEIMRTQHLARALLDSLRLRIAKGPLGEKGTAACEPADVAAKLREAIAVAVGMLKGIHFRPTCPSSEMQNRVYGATSAVELLEFVINATQRLYETQSLYEVVIAPAEYEALCENTPTDTFQ